MCSALALLSGVSFAMPGQLVDAEVQTSDPIHGSISPHTSTDHHSSCGIVVFPPGRSRTVADAIGKRNKGDAEIVVKNAICDLGRSRFQPIGRTASASCASSRLSPELGRLISSFEDKSRPIDADEANSRMYSFLNSMPGEKAFKDAIGHNLKGFLHLWEENSHSDFKMGKQVILALHAFVKDPKKFLGSDPQGNMEGFLLRRLIPTANNMIKVFSDILRVNIFPEGVIKCYVHAVSGISDSKTQAQGMHDAIMNRIKLYTYDAIDVIEQYIGERYRDGVFYSMRNSTQRIVTDVIKYRRELALAPAHKKDKKDPSAASKPQQARSSAAEQSQQARSSDDIETYGDEPQQAGDDTESQSEDDADGNQNQTM